MSTTNDAPSQAVTAEVRRHQCWNRFQMPAAEYESYAAIPRQSTLNSFYFRLD